MSREQELEQEIARLNDELGKLRLRKPRASGTAQLDIAAALKALDGLESAEDDGQHGDRIALVRRVLQREYDAYQAEG